MPALQRPVEILRDRYGINHIYAETEHDLFFAQGYNAARDRLFQLELWRRQATGTVAEVLGRRELPRDVGTRLFQFRKDLAQELAHYHPRGVAIVNAFVAGINAYVDQANQAPERLPLEFRMLGIRPEHWTPEVVISRHQGLLGNIGAELSTARAVATRQAACGEGTGWLRRRVTRDSADGSRSRRDLRGVRQARCVAGTRRRSWCPCRAHSTR